MTATSLFVQRSGVSLITDAAFYDGAGRIMDIASKVAVAPPELRMAIAVSGRMFACGVAAMLAGVPSQSEAFARISGGHDALRNRNRAAGKPSDFQLFVAMWSDARDRAEGWVFATDEAYFGPGYMPGTFAEIEQLVSPPIRQSFNLRSFMPATDGARILKAQRKVKHAEGDH